MHTFQCVLIYVFCSLFQGFRKLLVVSLILTLLDEELFESDKLTTDCYQCCIGLQFYEYNKENKKLCNNLELNRFWICYFCNNKKILSSVLLYP